MNGNMEDGRKTCYCCSKGNVSARNHNCDNSSKTLDIDAALSELGMLSSSAVERDSYLRDKRRGEMRSILAQTPPAWLQMPPKSDTVQQTLKIDTECHKDVPQQPPNSPVSPPFYIDHYKLRDFSCHAEYENRPLQSRRARTCGRQRMLSGPDSLILRHVEERDRYDWHPYKIPRPKVRLNGHTRTRTVSASLHEPHESASNGVDLLDSASQLASTTKAMETMVIADSGAALVSSEGNSNLPRSRSLESLSRPLQVSTTAVDGVSDRIENLRVT